MLGKKKGRPKNEPVDLTDDGPCARAFNLPPCFVDNYFFEGFPLVVSTDESAIIRQLDENGRR